MERWRDKTFECIENNSERGSWSVRLPLCVQVSNLKWISNKNEINCDNYKFVKLIKNKMGHENRSSKSGYPLYLLFLLRIIRNMGLEACG